MTIYLANGEKVGITAEAREIMGELDRSEVTDATEYTTKISIRDIHLCLIDDISIRDNAVKHDCILRNYATNQDICKFCGVLSLDIELDKNTHIID